MFQSNQGNIHLIKKKKGRGRESSLAGNPLIATDSITLSCPRAHHTHGNKAALMPTLISHTIINKKIMLRFIFLIKSSCICPKVGGTSGQPELHRKSASKRK